MLLLSRRAEAWSEARSPGLFLYLSFNFMNASLFCELRLDEPDRLLLNDLKSWVLARLSGFWLASKVRRYLRPSYGAI